MGKPNEIGVYRKSQLFLTLTKKKIPEEQILKWKQISDYVHISSKTLENCLTLERPANCTS